MKNIYPSVRILDERAVRDFGLSEEILLENAASGLENIIDSHAAKNSMIVIVVGTGNNGADGLALARRLVGKYNVKIFMPKPPKSELSRREFSRLQRLNATFIDKLFLCDIVVDCLFGSGFRGGLDEDSRRIIETMNSIARLNIACDVPSGISGNGEVDDIAFRAHITASMGGLKLAYFSDRAKDCVGEIVGVNLGLSATIFEQDSPYKLLESSDMRLPVRENQNCHKGNFGHCCVVAGEKQGACILSALAAFSFGAGLVSVVGGEGHFTTHTLPPHIMQTRLLPKNCSAIAFGMGLGECAEKYDFGFLGKIPAVIDADMFSRPNLREILDKGNCVLTPHLKEFHALLKQLDFGDFPPDYIAKNRIDLALNFSSRYPAIPLLLKGANTIIACEEKIYINTLGSNALAKGGSGDVLSGMIAALLAQKYSLLDAAITASLAHALTSRKIQANYALEPLDLIAALKNL